MACNSKFNKNTRQANGLITPPLREIRLSQLIGDAVRGQNILDNQRFRVEVEIFRINIFYKSQFLDFVLVFVIILNSLLLMVFDPPRF